MFSKSFRRFLTCISASIFLFPACASSAPIPTPQTKHNPTPAPTLPISPQPSQTENNSPFWDVSNVDISDIDRSKKLISFTFDDAPVGELEQILAVFASFNEENPDCKASATLFCNGRLINTASARVLHSAVALGFELGNHTYTHADLSSITNKELLIEVSNTENKLQAVDGKAEHLFRPPFGNLTAEQKQFFSVPIIDWTIDTLDWTGKSETEICETVLKNAFSGAIVLMHDGYKNTVTAIKTLLPALKKKGYQVTSVSKMAKAHDCPLLRGGRYIRARKRQS